MKLFRYLFACTMALLITLPVVSCAKDGGQPSTEVSPPNAPSEAVSAGKTTAVAGSGVAALVNGDPIPLSAVETAVRNTAIGMSGGENVSTEALMNQLGPRILDQLVSGELLYQEATKEGFKASKEKVDESFNKLAGQFPTRDQFNAEMVKRGFTEDSLKTNIKKQLTIQGFLNKTIISGIAVTDDEAKKNYDSNPDSFRKDEQVKASHILINVAKDASEKEKGKALARAREIAKKAREKGADFAALARENSEGPSGPSGGDLGYFGRGRMVKPFEEAVFGMKVGEVSDPVLTQFGYHVIKLTDRKEARIVPFEEVKGKIVSDLTNSRINEAIGKKIKELAGRADIQILFKPSPQSGLSPHSGRPGLPPGHPPSN
ncbi:MAG: peptidylprolyl isomerase [Deltaproteobacteria bacterium]|nr:peptidylprolyl isomerase [Deltaproteobacteria bacterium]